MSSDSESRMSTEGEHAVKDVNGRPTQVLSFGNAEEDTTHVVFIPGNPGVVGFYWQFLKALAASTETKFCLHAMSYPGHDVSGLLVAREGARDRLNLEEQIEHKIAFIKDHVPEGSKLILIGHSLGCYMIMQILKRNVLTNVQLLKIGLLCPVIARMAESPTGQRFGPFCKSHPLLGRALIRTASWLPKSFLTWFLDGKLETILGTPDVYRKDIVTTAIDFVKQPPCVLNAIHIGIDAIDVVEEMDVDTLIEHKERLTIWYTPLDHWVPDGMYQELAKAQPDLSIRPIGTHHAFMLHAAEEVAQVVGPWLNNSPGIH